MNERHVKSEIFIKELTEDLIKKSLSYTRAAILISEQTQKQYFNSKKEFISFDISVCVFTIDNGRKKDKTLNFLDARITGENINLAFDVYGNPPCSDAHNISNHSLQNKNVRLSSSNT